MHYNKEFLRLHRENYMQYESEFTIILTSRNTIYLSLSATHYNYILLLLLLLTTAAHADDVENDDDYCDYTTYYLFPSTLTFFISHTYTHHSRLLLATILYFLLQPLSVKFMVSFILSCIRPCFRELYLFIPKITTSTSTSTAPHR